MGSGIAGDVGAHLDLIDYEGEWEEQCEGKGNES